MPDCDSGAETGVAVKFPVVRLGRGNLPHTSCRTTGQNMLFSPDSEGATLDASQWEK